MHVVGLRGWRSHARCFMGTLVLAKSWAMTSYVFQALELLTGYKASGAIGQQHLNHSMCFPCQLLGQANHRFLRSTMQLLLAHMLNATAQPLLLSGQTCSLPLQFWDTHLLGALLEAFPVLSHRKKKFSSSQTLPLV